MRINFYDDPSQSQRAPEEVRISQVALSVYPDSRRVAVRLAITPFRQRPSLDLIVTNDQGEQAASITVIETLDPKLSFTIHLRDKQRAGRYEMRAELYYIFPDRGRVVVHSRMATFNITPPETQ
jgi:hypothetical protein